MRSENDAVKFAEPAPEGPMRERLRFLISLSAAGALGAALWLTSPSHMSGHINIVGYPTFSNFAFQRSFLSYRLIVWEFPIVSALVYALLRWRGPLRILGPRTRGRIVMVDPNIAGRAVGEPVYQFTRRVLQLVPPAILVAFAVSSGPAAVGLRVSSVGLLAGVAYIAAIVIVSTLVALLVRHRGLASRFTQRGETLALVNGFAGVMVSVGGLLYVSRHTLVITTKNERQNWPWFPVWLGAGVFLVVLTWMIWRLAGGWAPSRLERRIRTVLVGSVAVFLLTASIPGGIPVFLGFDDAQSVVGADLLTRGYFPWRDFMFIHGLFDDALRSWIGFSVFQHSIWGALAGTALIVVPLCWVAYYLLSVWAGPSGSLVGLGVLAVAAWGGVPASPRFIAVPLVFILLGEALRRSRLFWTILFTAAMFVEAVLVPEASFQVIAAAITIVAADVVHRDPVRPWWSALRRTRCFFVTGAALCVVLAVFLALNRALVPFLNYFFIFGPGHNAAGVIPPSGLTKTVLTMFAISAALVVLTTWMVAWRLFGRHPWAVRDWVTVAAAILTGFYGEKAIGRFDGEHVAQALAVGLPLWIMWVAKCLDATDDFLNAQLNRVRALRPVQGLLRQPLAVLALVLVFLLVPSVAETVWHAPGNAKRVVSNDAERALVGYTEPGGIDPLLLADLRRVVNTYAGSKGEIFDNTNSLGYFYYLLQRAPASTFVHVSMAEPGFAQQLLIDQLANSRPALIAFDADTIGLPAWEWDGPRNNIRHFKVAQYLLDGWTPILRTHSVLFILRNDLVANMPSVPMFKSPSQTSDLEFSGPACDWGYTANFLDSQPAASALSLPVTALGDTSRLQVHGWAYDIKTHSAPSRIVITIGNSVAAVVQESIYRPDVAFSLKDRAALRSGYDVTVTGMGPGAVGVYALGTDGTLHPIGATPTPPTRYVQMPDGKRLVVTARTPGSIEGKAWSVSRLLSVSVPVSADLASFKLATFTAPAPIGDALLELTDEPLQAGGNAGAAGRQVVMGSHEITANVLPVAGSSLAVRVGSCLQWRGYKTRTLYILQTGGVPITGFRMSGVRN